MLMRNTMQFRLLRRGFLSLNVILLVAVTVYNGTSLLQLFSSLPNLDYNTSTTSTTTSTYNDITTKETSSSLSSTKSINEKSSIEPIIVVEKKDCSLTGKYDNAASTTTTFSSSSSSSLLFRNDVPFIVVADGCVGSTALLNLWSKLITAHGVTRYNTGYEFLKTQIKNGKTPKNKFYKQYEQQMKQQQNNKNSSNVTVAEIMIQTVHHALQEAQSKNQVLFFKANMKNIDSMGDQLRNMGSIFFGVYRANALDRCICQVKDCFRPQLGYPVYAVNGSKTDLCFQRRKHPEVTIQAYITNSTTCVHNSRHNAEEIQSEFPSSASTDDLFAFEYSASKEALETSIKAWVSFLRPLLQNSLNECIIHDLLQKEAGTRNLPKPHYDLIYNYGEVKEELLKKPGLLPYLRRNVSNNPQEEGTIP